MVNQQGRCRLVTGRPHGLPRSEPRRSLTNAASESDARGPKPARSGASNHRPDRRRAPCAHLTIAVCANTGAASIGCYPSAAACAQVERDAGRDGSLCVGAL